MTNLERVTSRAVRVSNTARERLFTIGLSEPLFELLGGHSAMVDVNVQMDAGGLLIKIKHDAEGDQMLRNISHDEVGLRFNKKKENPITYPFKSVRLNAKKVDEIKRMVEIFLPSHAIRKAKPRGITSDGLLFAKRLPKFEITLIPKDNEFGSKIVFHDVPAKNKDAAIKIGKNRAVDMHMFLAKGITVKRVKQDG